MITRKHGMQFVLIIITMLGVCANVIGAPKMEIVKDGQHNAVIIVGKNAHWMTVYAAKELQTYLQKVSGAKLPVTNTKPDAGNVIYVGDSEYTRELNLSTKDLELDGFKIITGKSWLALIGVETDPTFTDFHPSTYSASMDEKTGLSRFGQTGSLYAVYHFLENQCGIRWYMPGELGEIVPKARNISVGRINYSKSPDIPYRNIYCNEFSLSGDDVFWFRRAGYGAPYPVSITHSFEVLNKYAKEHPEYFSIIDGERDFNKTCDGKGSLCLSNPGTVKAFAAEANAFFDKNPGQGIFPVMPNDNWFKMCECADCRKMAGNSTSPTGKYSEYVWNFVDRVAREVIKTHPDKLLGCCAYAFYVDPPKNIEKFSPNVAVMICKKRQFYWDKEYKKRNNDNLETWSKKCRNIFIWEYYIYSTGYSLEWRGLPIVTTNSIGSDLKHLKGIINGEFLEAESWVDGSSELRVMHSRALNSPNFYMTGKLYWDTSLDPKKLMDEYCRNLYGPAEKELKAFWTDSEGLWMGKGPDDYKNNIHEPTMMHHDRVYTPETTNALMSHLKKGLELTSEGSPERKRIEMLISDFEPAYTRINSQLLKTRPKLSVPFTDQAPTLDGNLNDTCWKNAIRVDFCDAFGSKPAYKSYGLLTWDEKNLYLAFANDDPNPAGITINHTGKDEDGIWDDEVNELFFRDESAADGDYFQFIINAGASVWDAHFKTGVNDPAKWNSNAIAKSAVSKDGWILEVSIPLSSIGLAEGKTITANFYRSRNNKDTGGATRSCWSPNVSGSNYVPDRFGYLTLKK